MDQSSPASTSMIFFFGFHYLVNKSDGAIDVHYAYLFTLQGGVTTDTQARAVLGHKFADLIESEGRWRSRSAEAKNRKKLTRRKEMSREALMVGVHMQFVPIQSLLCIICIITAEDDRILGGGFSVGRVGASLNSLLWNTSSKACLFIFLTKPNNTHCCLFPHYDFQKS